ncbi:hypothetical protein JL720_7035 [Aureococcus anophagefferens]|nr:hypothetical protein JL720_7035 [Aureococcus anophagefferens]
MKASKEETKEDGCLLDGNAPTKAMETAPSDASVALALVRRAALVANLSNLAFGYDVGVMSGALLYLRRPDQLGFTDVQAEVAASLFNLAAAAASLGVAGPLSDRRGRRAALLVSAALLLAGFVCQAFAPSFAVLAFGRARRVGLGRRVGLREHESPRLGNWMDADICLAASPRRIAARSSRAVFLNRLVSGTCAATFLSLTRRAGVDGTFAFYAVCSAMTAVVFARTPETKGLDLEAIHADAGADVELQSPLQGGAAV